MSSHRDWQVKVIRQHNAERPFAPENGKALRFNVGDKVLYTNDNGVSFHQNVTGLYEPNPIDSLYATGRRYLLDTDCYWVPVAESNLSAAEAQETVLEITQKGREMEMTPMNNDRLEAIRTRCEAATPEPWRFGVSKLIIDGNGHALFFGEGGKSNASFIAHARSDIPYLLAEVDRWKARAEALERALRGFVGTECQTCTRVNEDVCQGCTSQYRERWQFDEARFAGGGEQP